MEHELRNTEAQTEHHYSHGNTLELILQQLTAHGKDINHLTEDDLGPVDEFHLRGREGTAELATRIEWQPGWKLLDVGCGIGGSSRFLAQTYGQQVTGIDLTHEFIEVAAHLTRLVGLEEKVRFLQGSALELPFPDNSFDIVWTEHVQMNIEAKRQFYAGIARVLLPGGRFLFHDIFRLGDELPTYPMPWAEEPSYSFLTYPEYASAIIEAEGMRIVQWEDTTLRTLDWFERQAAAARNSSEPPLSPIVLMGENGRQKMQNLRHCLGDSRLCTCQAVVEKLSR